MFRPAPRAATYDVGEELQTVIKYLAMKLDVSTGTIIAMGVAAVEKAVELHGHDCYVITVDKEKHIVGSALEAVKAQWKKEQQ
jgi:hypothetical protein